MAQRPSQEAELLKRPLYVYDLPPELLGSLQPKNEVDPSLQVATESEDVHSSASNTTIQPTNEHGQKGSASCSLCGATFSNAGEQRTHAKTDWHSYNVKQRMKGGNAVDEAQFERLIEELDESISGSESSSTDDADADDGDASRLPSLLKRQAQLHRSPESPDDSNDLSGFKKRKRGSGKPPLIWFTSALYPENTSLGIYRALLTNAEQKTTDIIDTLNKKQLKPAQKPKVAKGNLDATTQPPAAVSGPSVFICMIGGGHFAAMIVSLTPDTIKSHTGDQQRKVSTIAQKTFHRYTTRRKQGGAQSANDAAKGNAHSAGAGIRRANEAALLQDVRNLLWEWRDLIADCELLFVRANGTTNRRLLFERHERQVLKPDDERMRSIPISTRRATQQECMRCFVELTRIKVSQVDEAALAAAEVQRQKEMQKAKDRAETAANKNKGFPATNEQSPEEEAALLHTSQLQTLIRRNKVPGLLSYLSKNGLSADFRFKPEDNQANHHASTPLHLAASLNSPVMVNALLMKAESNPLLPNGEGRTAFDLSGDRATRDAFRVARSELGEARWSWGKANVPAPVTRAEAEQRSKDEKAQSVEEEAARRKTELESLERDRRQISELQQPIGRNLGGIEVTAADKREQEARGLTPEMRQRLERERRARAAEERMKRLAGR